MALPAQGARCGQHRGDSHGQDRSRPVLCSATHAESARCAPGAGGAPRRNRRLGRAGPAGQRVPKVESVTVTRGRRAGGADMSWAQVLEEVWLSMDPAASGAVSLQKVRAGPPAPARFLACMMLAECRVSQIARAAAWACAAA